MGCPSEQMLSIPNTKTAFVGKEHFINRQQDAEKGAIFMRSIEIIVTIKGRTIIYVQKFFDLPFYCSRKWL